MKKPLLWIGGIILTPLVLILIVIILLYCPPVQKWAVDIAMRHASEMTGMQVTIESVHLSFPLDLELGGVKALKQNPLQVQKRDTVIDAKAVVCDVQLMPLFDSRVEVNKLSLEDVNVNTVDFVPQAKVKGRVGTLFVESHGADLKHELLTLNKALLADAILDVALSDTVPEDTTESQNRWKIDVRDLSVQRSRVLVHMPGDTLNIGATIGRLDAKDGHLDLDKAEYKLRKAELLHSFVNYDDRFKDRIKGFDANHIALSNLNVGIDNFYFLAPVLKVNINKCMMEEKSGLALTSLSGKIALDSTTVYLRDLVATTPVSKFSGQVEMDFNAFDDKNPGKMNADVYASVGRKDIELFAGALPKEINRYWKPSAPLVAKGVVDGNLKKCNVNGSVTVPGFVLAKARMNIIDMNDIRSDLDVSIAGGTIKGKADVKLSQMVYDTNLRVSNVNLGALVPGQGLGALTATLALKGKGTDVWSRATRLAADARIKSFRYQKYKIDNLSAKCLVANGKCDAGIVSSNQLMEGSVDLSALMNTRNIRATIATDIKQVDLQALGIVHEPFTTSVCGHVDIATDLNDYYLVQGSIADVVMRDTAHVFRPDEIIVDVLTRKDTTHVVMDCGDFHVSGNAGVGYKRLMKSSEVIGKELNRQWEARVIDEQRLRNTFPKLNLRLTSGRDNPIYRIARYYGYDYAAIDVDMHSSPEMGIEGSMRLDTLKTTDMQIDQISVSCNSDADRLHYIVDVTNGPTNPQYSFHAVTEGSIIGNGTTLNVAIDDKQGVRGLQLGLEAMMEPDGIRVTLDKDNLILGYKAFHINPDNYIRLMPNLRVAADVKLKADDGMGILVYSDDENEEALQDITLSLHKFSIAEVLSVIPYMPDVSGIFDGDFHIIKTANSISIASSVEVKNLIYEKCPMGNMSSEFVYIPQEDGTHCINGTVSKDDREVAQLSGSYNPAGDGNINAMLTMDKLPLNIINGFVPDQIIGLEGTGEGSVEIKGSLAKPDVNGEVFLEGASLISVPYGVSLRFDDDPVRVVNSKLLLENFQMYANNDQPLVIQGNVDFSEMEHIKVDMRMKAENYEIINAKENSRSEVYGNVFVNVFVFMKGELAKLQVRGKVDLLSSTNLYYILRDSPLTTDNQLKELVVFTDLNAEEQKPVARPTVDGLDVDLMLNVNTGSHVMCWLNADHSNYVDIFGNGNLRFKMRGDQMSLIGRYTINEGEMKYALPIIPLKNFVITSGSYVEFTGDIMNPRLSIIAQETTKAPVSVNDVTRMVMFKCGVNITKTLNDMGLEFIIDAPEEQSIHDELQMMSVEERGKLAVTMLTTGMYLTGGNTSGFSMNSALNSFLQSEINRITGSALRTLDLSFGMENSTDETGTLHTDYSFKFAKRFWNNRLSIAIGGKISSGSEASGGNRSFFDNIEVQYRLGDESNQYMKLYYNHSAYDYLEGYVTEYGGGYMWKRKLQYFRDIFRFREPTTTMPQQRPAVKTDSIVKFAPIPKQ